MLAHCGTHGSSGCETQGMTHELRTFTDSDGLTISYEIFGSGRRTLIYMHGLLLDSHVNRRLAESLAAAGNKVILVDLPGHGRSDKPLHASDHRMDKYATRIIHLMDDLGIRRAAVGGVSLGADVSLQITLQAPDRVKAMVLEMPVLERATPVAALLFTPLLTATHYAKPVMRAVSRLAHKVPRDRIGRLDQVLGPLLLEPEEMVAVLHGVLVGPVAPTAEERQAMTQPTLVIGHRSDRLHPFGDANRLAQQLPNGSLLEASSMTELRRNPERLTAAIADFLADAWSTKTSVRRSA